MHRVISNITADPEWPSGEFSHLRMQLVVKLARIKQPVEVNEWQSMDVSKAKARQQTYELQNVFFGYQVPDRLDQLVNAVNPDLPWAEDHFQERVSGEPLNPPPSAEYWPYAPKGHSDITDRQGAFSHSYPERFWPKRAGEAEHRPGTMLNPGGSTIPPMARPLIRKGGRNKSFVGGPSITNPHSRLREEYEEYGDREGIRFRYGDYDDLLSMLFTRPDTRQAYLPIWFPEDLAASVDGARVPCTLGYHFLMRDRKLHMFYAIRSCDFVHHWVNDVYMAARLMQHTIEQLCLRAGVMSSLSTPEQVWRTVTPGTLTMWVGSMHVFEGHIAKVRKEAESVG